MRRRLEKEVMDDWAQALAYAQADFSEPNGLFVDLLAARGFGKANGSVVDLGCGPADIPIRIASRWEQIVLIGQDASLPMLALARERIRKANMQGRIRLVAARLPRSPFQSHFCQAVISNSLLHHLPDPLCLWREAARLVRPAGTILVMDLLRPPSEEAARALVDRYSASDPHVLRRDFYNSLLAAFTVQEVKEQLEAVGLPLEVEQVSDRHWAAAGKLPAG